ncbi:hypothetical protein CCMA1212_003180 [Trichoderma ghanense]|uniref:F-box domain-containing protein n=1 Tax=Trichoderma ghanense TaxID=65468 RepID=A0ABY2HBR4_9HYPO
MDSLPFELITHILAHLPHTDLPSARLTCHAFNAALAKPTFSTLASFIDPAVAQRTIEHLAADLRRRPKSIWSPGCSVPRGLPVPESFLNAMRSALKGAECPCHTASYTSSAPSSSSPMARSSSISSSSSSSADSSAAWSDGEESDAGSDITMYTDGEKLTADNFGRSIGMDEVTEDVLRQALFRYALYLSYVYTGEGEAPQLWVMNSKKWAQQR